MSIIDNCVTCPQCGEVAMTRQSRMAFFMLPRCQSCDVKLGPRSGQTTVLLYVFVLALIFYICYLIEIGVIPGLVIGVMVVTPLFSLVPLEAKT